MLDRAPVLFRPSCDFSCVSAESIRVRTVQAIEAFQKIDVLESASIEDQVVRTSYFRNSVHGKANSLIGGQEKIEESKGNNAEIDDWRGHHSQDARLQ